MGFSVFSKPLGTGRAGMYVGGGAATGAGLGAALAGRDHRTSGAVVGGAAGTAVGLGISAAHALQNSNPNGIAGAARMVTKGSGISGRAKKAGTALMAGMDGPLRSSLSNGASRVAAGYEGVASKVGSFINRFRK